MAGVIAGIVPVRTNADIMEQERKEAEARNAQPVITELAAHIRAAWQRNKVAKSRVELRMLQSLRQRHGEYDPDTLAKIRANGGSDIYMMLTSTKCRGAASWIRDVLLSQQSEKPWAIDPTPQPDMPDEIDTTLYEEVLAEVEEMLNSGQPPSVEELRAYVEQRKSEQAAKAREFAKARAERMERVMEDQLVQGGFMDALSKFIDDLTTYPAAILKGPVVRNKRMLAWGPDGEPVVENALVPTWERVDPFDLYPAPFAESVNDGDLIERHRLSRGELYNLIGVEGYDDGAIRAVLDEYGRGGLREWLTFEAEKAAMEERATMQMDNNGLIDALQYWGSVQGRTLIEWGMEGIDDPMAEYQVEAWLVGHWVIRAVINPDPLARRPYYMTSYEKVPGTLWGNSIADLVRDCQRMANASARALADNMGIASGPVVWVNVDRMPPGEPVETLAPLQVRQFTADMMGGTAPPMGFFQASSNANELMAIYEKFSVLADEYSGVPRYMTGSGKVGGAGRTASGMSMLMSNAGKALKQVISNIDYDIIEPLIRRLYEFNMRFHEDDTIKGDVQVRARGVNSMIVKEAAQVRRNEFLAATANPIDMQIVGLEGRAALLREAAKSLDMNVDAIVPPPEEVRARQMAQMQAQQEQMAQAQAGGSPSGQELMDGTPVEDGFGPVRT